jgi:mono/diheme cytochrome c family protein
MEVTSRRGIVVAGSTIVTLVLSACPPQPPAPEDNLVARGQDLFFNETFEGNGRTCGTCHRAEENFTLSREFIAGLPDDDPLFVAEFIPELGNNFENPVLMRNLGLIVENQDGFDDLANNFNMRGIPHTLGMRFSVASASGPRTGWSGDGSPGDRSLRSFATGAVIQHFTKTTDRIPGIDFRLPTDDELDALEAFQLSLGRQEELILPLALRGPIPIRGQQLFMSQTEGKCNACHFNAGANGDPSLFPDSLNLNFNTGVENLPDQPGDLFGELNPPDDGFGVPGDGNFNVPSVVEAADTGPFFHNNSVETIEGAVAFYSGDAFTNSTAGQLILGATGSAINLDGTQVVEVAAFLRVINALENIRQATEMLESSNLGRFGSTARDLTIAAADTEDAIQVLRGAALHPVAILRLQQALDLINSMGGAYRATVVNNAVAALREARQEIIVE